jgi:signal transduction histidine kinase
MQRKHLIRLSIFSVIAMLGIILLQAYWVNTTVVAYRGHASEHIRTTLYEFKPAFCKMLPSSSLEEIELQLRNEVQKELELIQHPLQFSLEIEQVRNPSLKNGFQEYEIFHDYQCGDYYYQVWVDCDSTSFIWFSSLFWWLVLSVFLILFICFSMVYTWYSQRRFKNLEDIKKDFVSNMTHELKTPIATINVASKMLSDFEHKEIDKSRMLKYTSIIRDENARLQQLVDKVLLLSIFDQSQKVYKFDELNLVDILDTAINQMQLMAKSKNGQLLKKYDHTQVIINGDKDHLKNIFINIIENALKYVPNRPLITIQLWERSGSIEIDFADNGIGIPDSDKQKIFNRFHRSHKPSKGQYNGFGLGLSYVAKVMEMHGGSIKALDNEPQGTVFKLVFPCSSGHS